MEQKTNVCGVMALTFSLVSVLLSCCFGAGIIFGIPAFILGLVGLSKKNMGSGMALSGVIIGFLGSLLSITCIIFWLVYLYR